MTLEQINSSIQAERDIQARYESKRSEIEKTEVKKSHVYTGLAVGTIAGTAIVSKNMLDLGAMILGGVAGAVVGSLVPFAIKKIKIWELNYQIWMTEGTVEMLESQKEELHKTLIKK